MPSTNSVPYGAAGFLVPKPAAKGAKVRELPHLSSEAALLPSPSFGQGWGAPQRAVAAAAVVAAAGAVEESTRALSLSGCSEPGAGSRPSRLQREPRDLQENQTEPLPWPQPPAPHPASLPGGPGAGEQGGARKGGVSARETPVDF